MRIIFFGTSVFSAKILEHLLTNRVQVVAVVTKTPQPHGRGRKLTPTPVKQYLDSTSATLPCFEVEKSSRPEFVDQLKEYAPDLGVVVAYGEIVRDNVLNLPKYGCINIHASLLPKYRGAAPIQRAIMDGVPEIGVTIMEMVRKMDAGDIIAQASFPLEPNAIFDEVEEKLWEVSFRPLMETIGELASKGRVEKEPQDEAQVTYAEKIQKEDLQLDFQLPAIVVHNRIRALSSKPAARVGVVCSGEEKLLKIFRTEVVSRPIEGVDAKVGEMVQVGGKELFIICQEEALKLLDVQLEGKKRMLIADLLRGIKQIQMRNSI
ncbi:MAG: Methionyl-tRNA formyltransferase [Chlamydiia bacterium]|nr:Methionyl-tRNA formyltransferase [Chlamydiia bacterium]